MKQKLLSKVMLLLFALVASSSSVWATDYDVAYTFQTAQNGTNTAYAKNYDVTINEIEWSVPGNQNFSGYVRIGGKSLVDGVDRVIKSNGTISADISKITFNHNGVSNANLTVNSVKLTVASNSDFSTIIEEISKTPDVSSSGSFDFTAGEDDDKVSSWGEDMYYKFTINVTNSKSSNYGLDVTSIVFYKKAVTGAATTTTIDASGITNTDVYTGTAAGSLSATVKAGESTVDGATVTWSGDNDLVATIDPSTGAVTLVGVGTVTFTASYAGSAGSYAASSNTYEMTVTSTEPLTEETLTFSDLYDADTDINGVTINGTYFNVVFDKGTNANNSKYFKSGTAVRSYGGSNFVVSSSEKCIEQIDLTFSSGEGSNEITANKGSYDDGTWTGKAKSVRFFVGGTSGHRRIASIKVYYGDAPTSESVSVTSVGYATWASDFPLNFDGTGINAYIAVTKGDGTGVTFTSITKVPANTGLLLYAGGGATVDVPVFDGTGAGDTASNVLVPGTGATVATDDETNYNYILNNVGGNLGFYQANDQTVAANRAYISVLKTEASVREFIALPGGDETAISQIINSKSSNGEMYDLSGRRVSKATKGIYIVNGKKVVK